MKKIIYAIISALLITNMSGLSNVQASQKATATTLNVATFNIASYTHPDLKAISKQFADYDIDIAGIQEVDMFNGRNNYDMMAALQNDTYPYVDFGKGRDYNGGDFGVGVVSKYEFLNTLNIPTEGMGEATKAIERVEFVKDGKHIALYNYHPSYEDQNLRRRQFRKMIEYVNMDETPYKILTGDFNADQSLYEFTMFLDDFYIANGKDGVWFETFNGTDATMKVNTVDNIMCTKNIQIKKVDMVENKLSDHNMLYAQLELADTIAPKGEGNIALGQQIETSITGTNDPEVMVDYDPTTAWYPNEQAQSIVLSLDQLYHIDQIQLHWLNGGSAYSVETSKNGSDYELIKQIDSSQALETIAVSNNTSKYVRINLKENSNIGIQEIKVIGKVAAKSDDAYVAPEIIQNGGFEESETAPDKQLGPANTYWDVNLWSHDTKPVGWNLQMYNATGDPTLYHGTLNPDDKKAGNQSVVIKKDDTSNHSAFFKQLNRPAEPSTSYLVSFWIKTEGLDNNGLQLSISERDAAKKEVSNPVWKDMIQTPGEWSLYQKVITTNSKTATMDFTFKIVNPYSGTLYLDDFSVKGVKPTITVDYAKVSGNSIQTIGTTQQFTIQEMPQNAVAETYTWESTNPEIASVDAFGNVSAKQCGSTIIKIKSTSNSRLYSTMKLTVTTDKTKLNEAIKAAKDVDLDQYTETSVTTFKQALAEAKAIVIREDASQSEIDQAAQALQDAMNNLVEKEEPTQPDQTEKEVLVDVMESIQKIDLTRYSEASVKALRQAYAHAEAVLNDPNASAEEWKQASEALREAMDALEENETEAEKPKPEDKPTGPFTPDEPTNENNVIQPDGVNTGVSLSYHGWILIAGMALAQTIMIAKRIKEETHSFK